MSGEVSGRVLHCEKPVAMKGRGFHWEGEHEFERVDMECRECGALLTLSIRTHVGPSAGGAS